MAEPSVWAVFTQDEGDDSPWLHAVYSSWDAARRAVECDVTYHGKTAKWVDHYADVTDGSGGDEATRWDVLVDGAIWYEVHPVPLRDEPGRTLDDYHSFDEWRAANPEVA